MVVTHKRDTGKQSQNSDFRTRKNMANETKKWSIILSRKKSQLTSECFVYNFGVDVFHGHCQ